MTTAGLTDDEHFKQCFDLYQRISENARTTVFTFVLIFGALLLWALNAIVYPAEQQRLEEVIAKNVKTIICLALFESNSDSDPRFTSSGCPNKLKNTSLDYRADPSQKLKAILDATSLSPVKTDGEYIKHEIQYQFDKSADVARFNIPLIGVASDRSWFWLVNLVLGPFLLLVVRDSAANVRRLLARLYESSHGQPVRLILLSATQIISSSSVNAGKISGTSLAKSIVMNGIFALPIAVSGIVLYDWYSYSIVSVGDIKCNELGKDAGAIISFLCEHGLRQTSSEFVSEPEFIGGY